MIYIFKAGSLAASISNLEGQIASLIFNYAYRDYDFESHREEILKELKTMRSNLSRAPMSPFLEGIWDRCEERLSSLKESESAVGVELLVQLRKGLITQLRHQTFLMLDDLHGPLFDELDPFGDAVPIAFPMVTNDVHEAARCLALERYTACVFHLMRVLEHGLRWAAADLGRVMSPERDEQWKTLVDWMLSEIGDLEGKPKTPEKAERLQFYSGVALDLRNFKNAWRNDVSHSRAVYDEPEASKVWTHVQSFMRALASRAMP